MTLVENIKPVEETQPPTTPAQLPTTPYNHVTMLTQRLRRPLFIALALFIGLFYTAVPTTTIVYKDTAAREGWEAPASFSHYAFSLYSGIFVTSTVIFALYAAVRKNRPYVAPDLCLPALVSGLIYSGGLALWLLSTDLLGLSVAGPITAMVPGCVGSLWSVFYFREVKPGRSYLNLVVSLVLTMGGALAIGLSK